MRAIPSRREAMCSHKRRHDCYRGSSDAAYFPTDFSFSHVALVFVKGSPSSRAGTRLGDRDNLSRQYNIIVERCETTTTTTLPRSHIAPLPGPEVSRWGRSFSPRIRSVDKLGPEDLHDIFASPPDHGFAVQYEYGVVSNHDTCHIKHLGKQFESNRNRNRFDLKCARAGSEKKEGFGSSPSQ